MSPPNWDDDFDFEDIDDATPAKVSAPKKPAKKYDNDDFFDDENNKNGDSFALPSINTKKGPSIPESGPKQDAGKKNPYVDNMNLKDNFNANYEQDIYEESINEQDVGKNSDKNTAGKNPIKQKSNWDNNRAQISSQGHKEQGISEDVEEDNYEDENFEDAYDDDFEEEVETPKKQIDQRPAPNQAKTSATLGKPSIQPPRSTNLHRRDQTEVSKRNITMNKVKPPRPQSRNSIKSVNSHKAVSMNRSRANPKYSTNSSLVKNKYTQIVRTSLPEINLNELSQEKISALNDRVRALIKKFNDELNDMIEKNMLYLRSKKTEKSQTVAEKLRVYEEQRRNNETVIDCMQKEFEKLCGREGELRQQEYQLMNEKKTEELKNKIKQTNKQITKLQVEVKSEGNKLSRKDSEKKLAHELHHLKTTLIQTKKDEEKQEQKLGKLDDQVYELDSKVTDAESRIRELMDKARQKGIQLESREQVLKKYEDVKRKVQVSKNHRVKLQNLIKTKSDIISHEKQQLRINLRNYDLQIKNLYESINYSHGESIKVVEKAKNNSKISQNAAGHLEDLLKSLEQVEQIQSFSVRSESQSSHRPLRNAANRNMEHSDPHPKHAESHSTRQIRNDPNKPNLHKKKHKGIELALEHKEGSEERVWKDAEEQAKSRQEQLKHESESRLELQRKAKLQQEQKDKKKPFSLKKNRISSSNNIQQQPSEEPKESGFKASNALQEEEKNEAPSIIAGPRMMRLRRKNNEETEPQTEQPSNINSNNVQQKKEVVEQPKPFVPKRFNLRNRQQQNQNSYVPSGSAKNEPKEQPVQAAKQQPKQQAEFKINLDVDDPYAKKRVKEVPNDVAPHEQERGKEIENKLDIGSQSQKQPEKRPRLNLRLRDRKKEQQGDSGYNPSSNKVLDNGPPAQSSQPDPPPPQPPINNPYNPYANQKKAEMPSRRKEGPVKSKKPNQGAGGQKFNIYEQAEVVEGINEFADIRITKNVADPLEDRKPAHAVNQDVNLNDLLGIKKEKKNDDLADLLGAETTVANKRNKASRGGKNDFFDDMDF